MNLKYDYFYHQKLKKVKEIKQAIIEGLVMFGWIVACWLALIMFT